MGTICLEGGEGVTQGSRDQFSIPEGCWGARKGPLENVLQIRGGHEDGHQLESLHFYGVPWPHRRGLNSFKKVVLKLSTFFKKAVCKIQIDRRLESLHFKG